MKTYSLIILITLLSFLTFKKNKVYYLPFNIPGKQMAITIPPFGIFIEGRLKNNDELLRHEKVHWSQYQRMGVITFYTTYFKEYFKYGNRFDGPMEVEARKLSKQ